MQSVIVSIEGWLNRSLHLYKLLTAIAITLPVIILSVLGDDANWLKATLVSVSVFIVYDQLKTSPLMIIVHCTMISLCFSLFINFMDNALIFPVVCSAVAAFTLRMAGWGKAFRNAGSFTFIPALYLAFEFYGDLSPNFRCGEVVHLLVYIWGAALPTLLISIYMHNRHLNPKKAVCPGFFTRLHHNTSGFGARLEYRVPLLATAMAVFAVSLIVETGQISQGQWLIWSTVSVITGDAATAHKKYKSRAIGVVTGVPVGLLIGYLLPHNAFFVETGIAITALSIVSFKNYTLEFITRCACVAFVMTVLDADFSLLLTRVTNVLIGGLIGILIYIFVDKIVSSFWGKRP